VHPTFAMGEENARGHIIVTAPTPVRPGIIPAVLRSLRDLNVPAQKIRDGFLAAAAIGYLCKHNATLSVLKAVARQRLALVPRWVLP